MMPPRFHPAAPNDPPTGGPGRSAPPERSSGPGGRLNLLLTYASWRNDSWADRLPTLLEPMGITSIRARTGREAERTIRSVPVHIAVVDLGLPLDEAREAGSGAGAGGAGSSAGEEAGPRILELLRRLEAPPPTVVVKSPRQTRDDARHLAAALRFDAFAVVDRTGADIELMLKIFQRALARFYQDRWPSPPPPPTHPSHPTPPSPSMF